MNKQAYSYSVLRYVHDVTTGEFVNVGLALYCPALHYANATCRTTSKRLRPLFPSLDSDVFRALMRKVQTRFEALHDEVNSQLELRPYASVMELAQSVIPQDDSALQWAHRAWCATCPAVANVFCNWPAVTALPGSPAGVCSKMANSLRRGLGGWCAWAFKPSAPPKGCVRSPPYWGTHAACACR